MRLVPFFVLRINRLGYILSAEINIREHDMKNEILTLEVDPALKTELDTLCRKLGMNISTAFAILARKFIREQGIPAEVSLDEDMFYSPSNIEYLEKVTAEIDAGTAKLCEHELIEA